MVVYQNLMVVPHVPLLPLSSYSGAQRLPPANNGASSLARCTEHAAFFLHRPIWQAPIQESQVQHLMGTICSITGCGTHTLETHVRTTNPAWVWHVRCPIQPNHSTPPPPSRSVLESRCCTSDDTLSAPTALHPSLCPPPPLSATPCLQRAVHLYQTASNAVWQLARCVLSTATTMVPAAQQGEGSRKLVCAQQQ